MKLRHYLDDGANAQAKAVLAYLQMNEGIESSWDDRFSCYQAEITVARWHNGREQGYVASLNRRYDKQLNIAWFEHRSSDCICASMWEQWTLNPPSLGTAKFGDENYEIHHSVGYGKPAEMAQWIWRQFVEFWGEDKCSDI